MVLVAEAANVQIDMPRTTDTPSILLLDLPPSILCGIDLLSFTTTPAFQGIKNIPPGFHFLFTSETSSLSLRDGSWFEVPLITSEQTFLLVWKWDSSVSALRRVSTSESHRYKARELWERHLSPYRQSTSKDAGVDGAEIDWAALTDCIQPAVLSNMTQNAEWSISSASCMPEDREDIPGLTSEEVGLEERELGSLGIDLKRTWPEGAVGRERTEGATDRSWALGDVIKRWQEKYPKEETTWGEIVLGQMQICFLVVLTVANYSCLEEWKRCLELVLTSKQALSERQAWFADFLALLKKQMERCEDVDGGLFDLSDEGGGLLKRWLKVFKRTLNQKFGSGEGIEVKDNMEELEEIMKKMYGWDLSDNFLRKGNLQLEDGELVELEVGDMHGEDEDGEYAPVVVDLEDT